MLRQTVTLATAIFLFCSTKSFTKLICHSASVFFFPFSMTAMYPNTTTAFRITRFLRTWRTILITRRWPSTSRTTQNTSTFKIWSALTPKFYKPTKKVSILPLNALTLFLPNKICMTKSSSKVQISFCVTPPYAFCRNRFCHSYGNGYAYWQVLPTRLAIILCVWRLRGVFFLRRIFGSLWACKN